MPIRVLIVTGTSYGSAARTVACRICRSRSRFQGSAAPPPLRVTLGTGQPKFRSTCATAYSLIKIRVASAMIIGSTP